MGRSGDKDILTTIKGLMKEEHALRDTPGALSSVERGRMKEVEEALDQCWDLLRQRRAREEFGRDPDEAEARSVAEVENYRQ
ncbi:DUF2630 family protein [Nocardiopsis lambiniae]|uniref:DUF2630 family protein n=1 Tax=Nocardiopsis lambiniae TaxID=3075539 RepID=A0ABU2M9P9_9ACTN|nr:DUF2630 family protein [Nocardiopsis sp. DSM 44743]MDT0328686.1 DUF2630 family protein [Nocardiopsis sp. DSM 44743]